MIRILVIEDGKSIGGLLQRLLTWYVEEMGGAMAWEMHGAEGLTKADSEPQLDVVLLNVKLSLEGSLADILPITTTAYRFSQQETCVQEIDRGQTMPEVEEPLAAVCTFLRRMAIGLPEGGN